MKKIAIAALIVLGAMAGAPSTALAGGCEVQYTMAIAACNGNGPCGDAAQAAYYDCIQREAKVDE
jgi:hypothetical protein